MSSRVSGSVKWFDNRKGFGFINNLANGAEVFVHHSGLSSQNGVFRTLYPGEYIEFDLHHDEQSKRDYAVNVTGVKGGALLCENQGTRLMVRRTRPTGQQQPASDGFKPVQRRGNRPTRGRGGGSARGSTEQ
jgi:CspA family cold shock protein